MTSSAASFDITCVVNLHREGYLAHRTLRSVERAASHATQAGLTIEVLVVCDCPDAPTQELLARAWRHFRVDFVNHGDLGLARNHAVSLARGLYVGFVDGDDLISENWLVAAWTFGQENARFIMHPAIHVVFDQCQSIFRHPNQSADVFRNGALAFENFWSALSFARRAVYLDSPYVSHPLGAGYGFEDWYFNCQTIAAGYRHRAVPLTAHFIRSKATTSLSKDAVRQGAVLRHNALFDSLNYLNVHPLPERGPTCL